MKRITKIIIGAAFIAAIIVSFAAGSYIKEQKHLESRMQRCNILILFAAEKAENDDLSNQGVREALISNVYAAYEFCDKADAKAQLHDLWNTLIFEDDSEIDREMLMGHLTTISEMMKAEE